MYAIVETGGTQWKVSKSNIIRVPKLDIEEGKKVELDKVLLIVDKENVNIGRPYIKNGYVKATVLSHGKDKKIKVFKKKRRKDYKVLKGHRQWYTELRIDNIGISKTKETVKEPATAEVKSKKIENIKKKSPEKVKSGETKKEVKTRSSSKNIKAATGKDIKKEKK